ncbi:MAG: prepilin-type N-terminal cleavage/methylation domain-containing protein [Gammaproteobacteria bacterium]
MRRSTNQRGFTLIEIAIVIVIVGLLLGGLIGPLSVRLEQEERAKTQVLLEEIKEALLGYAAINGVLPCPTTEPDPANVVDYGVAATSPCPEGGPPGVTDGILPWKTLGVSPTDAWGRPRTATGDPWRGYWRYRVDRNFTNPVTPITLTTGFNTTLKVVDADYELTTDEEPPIAIIFSAGGQDRDNTLPLKDEDGKNADYDNIYEAGLFGPKFDDMTIWLSRPLLFNRMIMAGQLP